MQRCKKKITKEQYDRAVILRLCNAIEDFITEIDKLNMSYSICLDCKSIREMLKAIGKELTGDAGTE